MFFHVCHVPLVCTKELFASTLTDHTHFAVSTFVFVLHEMGQIWTSLMVFARFNLLSQLVRLAVFHLLGAGSRWSGHDMGVRRAAESPKRRRTFDVVNGFGLICMCPCQSDCAFSAFSSYYFHFSFLVGYGVWVYLS